MAAPNERPAVPPIPAREGGALIWAPADTDVVALQKAGWTVHSYRELHDRFITPARSRGTNRSTLANPAQPLLDLIAQTPALAVVGVAMQTAADLRAVYGFLIEPAYRRGSTLLIATDVDLDAADPAKYVDPIGYPWTLERLRYVAARFRLGPPVDGLPPLTPIEAILYAAMRGRGLTPVAQYGIGPYRADFAFPAECLVVECDGRPWHDPDHDRRRDAALRHKGWEPLHFTGSEITIDAASCAARVQHEIKIRRASVETPPVEVVIPERRSWWVRLVEWIRARFHAAHQPAAAGSSSTLPPARLPADVRPWTSDLDPEQHAAVTSHDGIVQVIAPAGSGKTTVLVARVQELVSRGVAPNRILCCTFNSAAAEELGARLEQAGVDGVEAKTFHGVGRQVLKRADLLRKDIGSLSYGQWRYLANQAMKDTPDGVWIEAPDARDQISDLKLGRMLTVDEYAEIATSPAERTLATLYRLYEETLATQDLTDFDDLIFRAVRLLQTDEQVRRHWQGEYTAVLVDEYQDIEPAQELLIHVIAAPEDLLLCVGDEDQCLYAWRRASVERVIELDQVYPGLERHALARNYRCPTLVVDASRSLISRNRRRFPKQILAARSDPGEIVLTSATDLAAQASQAARLVGDLEQGQAVILARTARVLSEVALGLAQAGIRFFGPERIKRQTGEPAVLLAYVRLLGSPLQARPQDVDMAFRVPNRYLPDGAEDSLASGLRSGLSFSDAIARLRVGEAWRRDKLVDAGHLFDELAQIEDASELIHQLRTRGGLDRHYADAEQLNPTDKSAIDTLAHAEDNSAGMTPAEFAGALDYEAHIIEQHFDKKGIELATIHGAKGRQWPLVVLAGAEEGDLPHARSVSDASDPDGEMEGERRLAYVAYTRAKDRLVILYTAGAPSRFIAEAAIPMASTAGGSDEILRPTDSTEPANASHVVASTTRSTPASAGTASSVSRPAPQPPTSPVRVPYVRQLPAPRVAMDAVPGTSIPCSLPGCYGTVGPTFVNAAMGGYVGLCARYEHHEALAAGDPEVASIWIDLKQVTDEARRRWRASTFGDADDQMPCSLPGCGGLVKPEYMVEVDGVPMGLCPQRALHEAIARRDPSAAEELKRLLDLQRGSRGRVPLAPGDRRWQLLEDGGIPCSIPGCDGVVAAQYVLDSDEGEVGICGIAAAHARLISIDPIARAEFERLTELRRDGANSANWSFEADLDDLPF